MESPHSLKSNEMAEVVFVPQQPLVVDSFKNCEGLSRIAFLDGNNAAMLGKVTALKYKKDMPPDEAKKEAERRRLRMAKLGTLLPTRRNGHARGTKVLSQAFRSAGAAGGFARWPDRVLNRAAKSVLPLAAGL